MITRTCDQCGKRLITQRRGARFCDDECKNAWHNQRRHSQGGTDKRFTDGESGVGSRGGNVRDLDDARGLQEEQQDKARWTLIVREQIARTLLETGYFHADDVDGLGVPPAHCNVRGSQIGSFRSRKLMEKTGAERKVAHAAANGRKAPIYRITAKGRRELPRLLKEMEGPVRDAVKRLYGDSLVGVRAGVPTPQGPGGVSRAPNSANADSDKTSSTNTGKGPARSNGATLDRPASSQDDSHAGARLLDDGAVEGSSTGVTSAVGEPTALPGLELEGKPQSAWTDPELGEAA